MVVNYKLQGFFFLKKYVLSVLINRMVYFGCGHFVNLNAEVSYTFLLTVW